MSTHLKFADPSDSLHAALSRMTEARVSRLPVVSREDSEQLLGMIDARDIAQALDRQLVMFPEWKAGLEEKLSMIPGGE